jgi:hypothetical protein
MGAALLLAVPAHDAPDSRDREQGESSQDSVAREKRARKSIHCGTEPKSLWRGNLEEREAFF